MQKIVLSNSQPFGMGKQRAVYRHPSISDLVIKVPLDHVVEDHSHRRRSRFHRRHLFRHLADTYSETRALLILYARRRELPFRVARFHGFVETDLGIGEICELKKGSDGLPAPSLRDMLRNGCYTDVHRAALTRFLDWLLLSDLTLKELHPGNLVYADVGTDHAEFVLVDGVGEKGQLALRSRFALLNRWHKHRLVKVLFAKISNEDVAMPKAREHQGGQTIQA